MAVVIALVMAGCGGGSDSVPDSSGAEVAEPVVDELVSVLGDEEAALAAVVMAGDRGYGVAQIVPAAWEGALQPDGVIVNADGSVAAPEYEPTSLLDDDVTGEAGTATGFRAPPERVRLTWFMRGMSMQTGSHRASAAVLLVLFARGYSFEQIATAVLAGDALDGTYRGSKWYLDVPVRLIDQNGDVIEPERPEEADIDDFWSLPARPDRTTTTTTSVAPADDAAPETTISDDTVPDSTVAGGTQPVGPAGGDGVWGGSVFQITAETPGLGMFAEGSGFCLDYSTPLEGGLWLSLTACTDTPTFDIVHDLEAGTIAGSIDLELECPGIDRWCADRDQVSGTVSGSFGPIAYGQQPEEVPDGWPFPIDHWYSPGSGYWWAGGPIELDVSIAGDHYILESIFSADVTTTITGWMDSSMTPASLRPGELPTEWLVNFRVIIETADTVDPWWDFYVGYDATFEEGAVDIPPWKK
jgi:hypothetical protein